MIDFLVNLLEFGTEGRRWRSPWSISGLVIGAVLGAWVGVNTGGGPAILTGFAVGGVLGWLGVVLLKGFGRVFVLGLGSIVPVALWMWITGEFG
ncbi:MAG: hypothetical protein ACPGID_11745 [Rubricella sp.]